MSPPSLTTLIVGPTWDQRSNFIPILPIVRFYDCFQVNVFVFSPFTFTFICWDIATLLMQLFFARFAFWCELRLASALTTFHCSSRIRVGRTGSPGRKHTDRCICDSIRIVAFIAMTLIITLFVGIFLKLIENWLLMVVFQVFVALDAMIAVVIAFIAFFNATMLLIITLFVGRSRFGSIPRLSQIF